MEIVLENLGKRFIRRWIFRGIDYHLKKGCPVAVTGPNGSGKSTLLRILSGWMLPSTGSVSYQLNNSRITVEDIFSYIDYVAPYTELIEELTLREFINFHFSFKHLRQGFSAKDIIQRIDLRKEKEKQIRYFSSGMKQRLKLGIAFYSETPILLLDEPTSNLDEKNKRWYSDQINSVLSDKIVIIASNQKDEFVFANHIIHLPEYNSN